MKNNANKKAADQLFKQIYKAAELAQKLETSAGKDAYTSLCEVMRELELSRMGGFNDEE